MYKRFLLTALLGCWLSMGWADTAPMSTEELEKEVYRIEDAMAEIRRYPPEEREQALEKAETELNRLERYLAAAKQGLTDRQARLSDEAQEKREGVLALLRSQKARLQQEYEQLQEDNVSRWDRGMARLERAGQMLIGLLDWVFGIEQESEENDAP